MAVNSVGSRILWMNLLLHMGGEFESIKNASGGLRMRVSAR